MPYTLGITIDGTNITVSQKTLFIHHGGLGLDLTKANIQFTNPGTNGIIIRVGVKK